MADFCSMECQAESYILFRDGQPRDVNEVNDDMLTYVVAVSWNLLTRFNIFAL